MSAKVFWASVDIGAPEECWLWTAGKQGTGYGSIRIDGRQVLAHRFAYEEAKGPIPEGLEIDHLCRTTACVNPNHLEAVTHRENMRRGKKGSQTHCIHGHPFDEKNTYIWTNGHRYCRACAARRQRERKRRRRLEATT